jgi:hypothetical protein
LFKSFVLTWAKLAGILPAAVVSLAGLHEASERFGFAASEPAQHQKIVSIANVLLFVLTEHWLGYILATAVMAVLWTYMVAEPKASSKRKFSERLAKRIGKRK